MQKEAPTRSTAKHMLTSIEALCDSRMHSYDVNSLYGFDSIEPIILKWTDRRGVTYFVAPQSVDLIAIFRLYKSPKEMEATN